MASKFVFNNYALQYFSSTVATRFQLFLGVYNPIQIQVSSQDIQTDQYGQYTSLADVDLLALHKPPYAPQPNFGSNRIGFVGEALLFDGSRSTERGNIATHGHAWTATGSPSIVYYNHDLAGQASQCSITWNAPGLYEVTMSVTDRFGSTSTGKRQVVIYQDRDSAPAGITQLSGLTGSIDAGGWSGSITTTRQNASFILPDALPIGYYQPIVIMAEVQHEISPGVWTPLQVAQYGAQIPGQFYDDPRIVFAGYIQHGSAVADSEKDTVTFSIQTVQMILQQAGIHNIGYYHTTYNNRDANYVATSLNPATTGHGQYVADLTSEDVYRSLLLDHCTIGKYHDLIIWRDMLMTDPNGTGRIDDGTEVYYLTYTHLTANEGMIWDACSTLAKNEFADIYADRNGAICIGPSINMRGFELTNENTHYPEMRLDQILNRATELQGSTATGGIRAYPHFLWGPNPIPQAKDTDLDNPRSNLGALLGFPIVGHFSDIPVYDTDPNPPLDQPLFTSTLDNWPQDLSIRPMSSTVDENYTTRASFVKLVGTLVDANNVWSAWFPTEIFDCSGLQVSTLPAGTWQVESQLLLADITAATGSTAKQLTWQYLWEMARRRYKAMNATYALHLSLGLNNWIRLHDVFQATRQNVAGGPKFSAMPFYTTSVTFNINLDQQQWTTDIDGAQVTCFNLGPQVSPRCPLPK